MFTLLFRLNKFDLSLFFFRTNPTVTCDSSDIPSLNLNLFAPRRVVVADAQQLEPVKTLQVARSETDKVDSPSESAVDQNADVLDTDNTERQLDGEIQHLIDVLKQLENDSK